MFLFVKNESTLIALRCFLRGPNAMKASSRFREELLRSRTSHSISNVYSRSKIIKFFITKKYIFVPVGNVFFAKSIKCSRIAVALLGQFLIALLLLLIRDFIKYISIVNSEKLDFKKCKILSYGKK